jgi:hypothetical protein
MEPQGRAQRVYTLSREEPIMRIEMRKFFRKTSLAIVALAPLAACSADKPAPTGIAPPTRIPDAPKAPVSPTENAGDAVSAASVPREVRRAVVADAARRFKVPESAVVVSQAEQVTWNDGSLGCPQPGQMYTQMLVSGYRIVATSSAGQMEYHTDSHGLVVTCGDGAVAGSVQPPARSAPDR